MSDLGDLGLSSYEESAYRTLLSLGRVPASDVAAESEVPEGRIYDVLNGLASRDLVRSYSATKPSTYEAVDPESAVDALLAERRRDLDEERAHYEGLAEDVSAELGQTLPVQGQFWEIGMGSDEAVAAMGEQFDRAETSLLSVVGPPYDGAAFESYRTEVDAYADLVDAGIEVKLLTTPAILDAAPTDRLVDVLDGTDGFAVRATPEVGLTYDVLDGESVYVSLPAPFTGGERVGAVVVRDGDLANAMEERFRTAWAEATPFDRVVTADD